MINGFIVYDADAHAIMSPAMWHDLPEDFIRRRPRAVRIIDTKDLGRWNTGWLIEGRMEPHVFGPGSHAAEADDATMTQEMELLGENQILFSSDFPDDEGRGDAVKEILERDDLSEARKRKILCDNTVRFFDGK